MPALDCWRRAPERAASLIKLGMKLLEDGRHAEAALRECLEIRQEALAEGHWLIFNTMSVLGESLVGQGAYRSLTIAAWIDQLREAEPLLVEAVEGAKRILPDGDWYTDQFLMVYGECLTKLKRYADAERALTESVEILETAFGQNHKRTRKAIKSLADLYDAWDKPDQAAECRAKLKAIDENSSEPQFESKEND